MALWRRWKRLKKSRKILVAAFLGILAGLLAYSFVYPPLIRWHVGELLDVSFPESASNFHYYSFTILQGRYILIRFDLHPADLPAFVDQLDWHGTGMLKDGYNPLSDVSGTALPFPWQLDWWKPNDAQIYAGGEYPGGAIVVDMTNPKVYTVYITPYF